MAEMSLFHSAFARHREVVDLSMQHILPDVERAARIIRAALGKGRTIFACGNGGSAADSQHFAAELVGRYHKNRRGMPAIALTVDTSALTALGNDYGFESVFKRQVEALGRRGDVLVAFTTSGSSKNVIEAIRAACGRGMKVIALTGARGKSLGKRADVCVVVPSEETARIQEIHEIVYHSWCEYLDRRAL